MNYKVHTQIFDGSNSSKAFRRGHRVRTDAFVVDDETGYALGEGRAYLNTHDTRNDALGEQIATGRALKQAGIKA